MNSGRQYCSEVSSAVGENLLGTAPQVDFWLLIEYRQQWSRDAVKENELPERVQSWLQKLVQTLEEEGRFPRIQFIRQSRGTDDELQLFVCQMGELHSHTFTSYEELPTLDLEADLGSALKSNYYFVCTHGTRDLCCSRFGLTTWRELQLISNGRTWQSSHLGGHRYAPNVLVLPHGRLYGRVHKEDVGKFFKTVESGDIAVKHLRGRSEFSKDAQACECLVDGKVGSVVDYGSDSVTFDTESGPIQVQVPSRGEEIEVLESCKDEELTLVKPFSDI
ncbi:MAG: hypothetical protein OXG24_09570 [Gammaproteobacteria bacterium]|nr:hypothetical protein [Gammaproteobacteria bacterium]